MKNYLKYSIMITLTLMITIGLANAQPPISLPVNANPYESTPATNTNVSLTVSATYPIARSRDKDLTNFGTVYPSGTTTAASIEYSAFENTPVEPFTITWISLRMRYKHPGCTDDSYRIEYAVGASAYTILVPDTAGPANKFDSAAAFQFRSFSQLVEPNDGTWSWGDIAALKLRIYWTRGLTVWDGATKIISISEVWASVYSSPLPPTSSPTMSLQPPSVSAGTLAMDYVFVEVYCNDVTSLAGWQYQINFDPAILTPTDYWNYYPWTDQAAPEIGLDYINVDGTIPVADPYVTTGLTGKFAVARIYFMVNDDGSGLPVAPNFSWLRLTVSLMGDPGAGKISHRVYDGYYGTLPENTYVASWVPASLFPYDHPISTDWVEQFPHPDSRWHLTSWEDNGDLVLSASDQIDMTPTTPPGPVQWFHVDQIWQSDTGIGGDQEVHMILMYKPTVPEFPLGIGILLGLAPAIPLIYLWRTRPKRRVQKQ
jgi:hypothetical protein